MFINFAIFIKDLKGYYLWGNDFFLHQSAGLHSLQEIRNKQDYDFPWHSYASHLRNNDELLFDRAESICAHEKILRHDGSAINIISKKNHLLDKERQIIGLIGFSMELPSIHGIQTLTPRERNILLLLCEGYTDKQTAKKLNISPRTVEAHINHSKQKLNVKTRSELIALFSKSYP